MSQTLDRSLREDGADGRPATGFGLTWMALTAIGFAAGVAASLAFMWNVGESL